MGGRLEFFILSKQDLGPFLLACEADWRVQVPVAIEDGTYRFAPLAEMLPDEIALEYLRTQLPPKKYFFPPEEDLYRFGPDGYLPVELEPEPLLLFGLHPCDIHGLHIADYFFQRQYPDRTYNARRAKSLVIGLGCLPDAKCFCASLGTSHVDSDYDIFLWDLGERFYVMVRTESGHDLIHLRRELFHPVSDPDEREYLRLLERRRGLFTTELEVSDLPQVLETQQESPVWHELGAVCFACGACSMVCPTCTCYDLFDRPDLSGCGSRCRRWDSCMFRDFDRGAGDHHFRARRGDRVRNRYYHKEHGFVNEFGLPSCVGCGRCINACPAGINVVNVFRQVRHGCGMGD